MPELFDIRSADLDARAERELMRKVSEAENATRSSIERERRVVADRRAQLEAQVIADEERLVGIKEAALALQEDVSNARHGEGGEEAQNLVELWPQVEEASVAAREFQAELTLTRQRGLEEAEAQQERRELDAGLFQMNRAATGIHWDHNSQKVEGYVALASARHFSVSSPRGNGEKSEAKADTEVARSEALWQEIEASLGLPPLEGADRPPWEQLKAGGA